MKIFDELTITDFRGISKINLGNFRQFNIIMGGNDTGKTSILEALYIAINPANPHMALTTNIQRGISVLSNP
jgi:AAA15 family ATPase/GTPase